MLVEGGAAGRERLLLFVCCGAGRPGVWDTNAAGAGSATPVTERKREKKEASADSLL